MMRPATPAEVEAYLNGYAAFPGSMETDEGLML